MKIVKFETDIQMYEHIEKKINEGYQIIDGINHSIIISSSNETLLLTFQDIPNDVDPIEYLKANSHKKEIIKPNYSNSILNVISAIRKNYGYKSKYKPAEYIFDKHYERCIILLVDGLGINILNKNLPKDSFLVKNLVHINHSIFPSTTAAATTSTISGLSPIETAWTGWENYFKEVNKNLILFSGIDYVTDIKTDFDTRKHIPYNPFFHDMDKKGIIIEPDFSKHESDINIVLNRSLKQLSEYPIQYVYNTEPDSVMHVTGPYSKETKMVCQEINDKIEAYASKLPKDTLLIITADHGHTAVNALNLYANKQIINLLERRPSNDSRCVTFKVKKGMENDFEKLFNIFYSDSYLLLKSKDAIKEEYFGCSSDPVNPRCEDFLADYVAVGIGDYHFNYKNENSYIFKSHHAGITKDEMEIPIILVKK